MTDAEKKLLAALKSGVAAYRTGQHDAMQKWADATEALIAKVEASPEGDTTRLQEMMRDPRYWRDRDPSFIQQVVRTFRARYAKEGGE
jgi:hypothetical protein